jgi:hypothetical protein
MAAARRRYERFRFTGTPEDPEQECACELAAGTVALLAGIGTGQFSPAFLRDRARGMTGRARRDAMNVTRVIWQAIAPALEERQVAA